MYTKMVVLRAIAGVALTATLIGGSAMVAGAADAGGLDPIAVPSASAATGDVLPAEASTTSTATTAADADAAAAAAAADPGRGPTASQAKAPQANKNDHAWQAGPDRCEDWQLTMDYRDRPDRSTAEALGFDLVFTNAGSQPCSFNGWPGLVAEGADGETLTWALASGSTSTLVVLPPNGGQAVAEGTAVLPSVVGLSRGVLRPPAGLHLLGRSRRRNRRRRPDLRLHGRNVDALARTPGGHPRRTGRGHPGDPS